MLMYWMLHTKYFILIKKSVKYKRTNPNQIKSTDSKQKANNFKFYIGFNNVKSRIKPTF